MEHTYNGIICKPGGLIEFCKTTVHSTKRIALIVGIDENKVVLRWIHIPVYGVEKQNTLCIVHGNQSDPFIKLVDVTEI